VSRPRKSLERTRRAQHLGRCLAIARERAGLSQAAAAEALGLHRHSFINWEGGATEPLADDLLRLADLYGLTLDQLVGRQALPPPERKGT
jgi:transcriptional regulator with XRE-family HTH domain